MKEFGEHLKVIFKEMSERVGAKDVDFHNPRWFMKYSWTEDEQVEFTKWLADYFHKTPGARRELFRFGSRKTKKYCNKVASEFAWNYGWSIK